jgi:hypothetical protein
VLLTRDAIVAVGAMIATELYGADSPVVIVQPDDFSQIAGATRLQIVAWQQHAEITLED